MLSTVFNLNLDFLQHYLRDIDEISDSFKQVSSLKVFEGLNKDHYMDLALNQLSAIYFTLTERPDLDSTLTEAIMTNMELLIKINNNILRVKLLIFFQKSAMNMFCTYSKSNFLQSVVEYCVDSILNNQNEAVSYCTI